MRNYKEKEILIFDAAWELFFQRGFHETKISAIAKKAGIGKGTIYEYFKSKEEVAVEMIVYYLESSHIELINDLESIDNPEEQLRYIGYKDIEDGMGMFKIMKVLQMIDTFNKDSIKQTIFRIMQTRFITIQSIIEKGINQEIFEEEDAMHGTIMFTGAMNNAMMINNISNEEIINKKEMLNYIIEKLKK